MPDRTTDPKRSEGPDAGSQFGADLGGDGELAWALLDAFDEAVVLLEVGTWRVLAVNQAMADRLGTTVHELLGTNALDRFPPEEAQPRLARLMAAVRTGQPLRFLDQHNGRDLRTHVHPMLSADGKITQLAVFVRDLTEFRRARETERLAALGRLSAGVAHEFNNLMAALLLSARMLEERSDSPEINELVDLIVRSASSGRDICGRLMTFAQQRDTQWQTVDIHAAIETAVQLCARHMHQSQVLLRRLFHAPGCFVRGDLGQLGHVFLNLFLNACHAMPEGGVLTVRTEHRKHKGTAGTLVVTVTDTGTGIAQDDLPHLFEPFFTTKGALGLSDTPGTGLGLSVCYGIVDTHSGTITVQSKEGHGTTFTLRLPACEGPPEVKSEPEVPAKQKVQRRELGGRVLVAEDQPDMLKLLRRLLAVEGCKTVITSTTPDALEALASHDFDLVVSDLLMPGGSGLKILEAARALPVPPPVLIITGSADPAMVDEVIAKGAAACLLKPFELSDFRRLLGELLEAKGSG